MRISIIAVGKLKEKYWRDAVAEYVKRLGAYCRLEILEVADEGFSPGMSASELERVKKAEWNRISRRLREDTYPVLLDIQGEQVSSTELAARMDKLAAEGRGDITFIIGGALGLPRKAREVAAWRLSFSRMTFPHQLMRVILLEQLYRAHKISRGEPYHY